MDPVKTCYIINFYLGDRRNINPFYEDDKLSYLKKHIELLSAIPHNLSKIVFNFNLREEDYHYISEIWKITPKRLGTADVTLSIRPNKGMSYGAWNDTFEKYKSQYDYYIFNEDDYFFIEPNWDQYLVTKYTSSENCGYLCMMVRQPAWWNGYKKHAGHSVGIASTENLLKVYYKYGVLPHNNVHTEWKQGDDHSEYQKGENSQILFSFAFIELGMNVLDVSDDYKVAFNMTGEGDHDIWKLYWWNEKELITPAHLLFNLPYSWYISGDNEFLKGNIYSTVDEALQCYKTQSNPKFNI